MNNHLKSPNTKKAITYGIRIPGFGQACKGGCVKPVNGLFVCALNFKYD